ESSAAAQRDTSDASDASARPPTEGDVRQGVATSRETAASAGGPQAARERETRAFAERAATGLEARTSLRAAGPQGAAMLATDELELARAAGATPGASPVRGPELVWRKVSVLAAGQTILSEVELV